MSEKINKSVPAVDVVGNPRSATQNPPKNEPTTKSMGNNMGQPSDITTTQGTGPSAPTTQTATNDKAAAQKGPANAAEKPAAMSSSNKDENPPSTKRDEGGGGNDQVTLDLPPKQPLVSTESSSKEKGVVVEAAAPKPAVNSSDDPSKSSRTLEGAPTKSPPPSSSDSNKPAASHISTKAPPAKSGVVTVARGADDSKVAVAPTTTTTGAGAPRTTSTATSTSSATQPAAVAQPLGTKAAVAATTTTTTARAPAAAATTTVTQSTAAAAATAATNISASRTATRSSTTTTAAPASNAASSTAPAAAAPPASSSSATMMTTRSSKLPPAATSTVATAAALSSSATAPSLLFSSAANPQQLQQAMMTTEQQQPPAESSPFAPYMRPTDQNSLEQTRLRLQTALQQTYQLRQAFTERVHGKYRVCLFPPRSPEHFHAQMKISPAGTLQRLSHEMAAVQSEKDSEKKQAAKLNSQVELLQQPSSTLSAAQKQQISTATRAAAAMWKQGTVDHADQLMYFSAGLNLVILPEDDTVSAEDLKGYIDRSPIHHVSGQRVKNLSLAAATAGHVMLERKRKALALRMERQQQQMLLLSASSTPGVLEGTMGFTTAAGAMPTFTNRGDGVGAMGVMPATTKTKAATAASKQPSGRKTGTGARSGSASTKHSSRALGSHRSISTNSLTAAVAGKTGRSRAPAGLSAATLLNLNPTAEELVRRPETAKASAATMALMARGGVRVNAHSNKMTQQRLRHPHPESLGGRRRSSMNHPPSSNRNKDGSAVLPGQQRSPLASMPPPPPPPEPFLQSYLQLTLPPLPATKDRLERKPLPVVSKTESCSQRVKDSVQSVLTHFQTEEVKDTEEYRQMTRIEVLRALNQVDGQSEDQPKPTSVAAAASGTGSAPTAVPMQADQEAGVPPIDPILTFSVLNAVGLIGRAPVRKTPNNFSLPSVNEKNAAMWSPRLKSLHKEISESSDKVSSRLGAKTDGRKRDGTGSVGGSEVPVAKRQKVEFSSKVSVEHIRGGGEALPDDDEGGKVSQEAVGGVKSSSRKGSDDASEKSKGAASRSSRKGSDASARSRGSSDASEIARAAPAAQPSQLLMHPASMAAAHPPSGVVGGYPNTLSTMQLATHMQQLQSGNSDLGSIKAQTGYDLTALGGIPGTGMVGYALPDRTAAAHALLVREQQAALLGAASHGYQQPTPAAFPPHVAAHPAAVSALLAPHAQNLYASGLAMNALGTQRAAAFVAQQQQQQKQQQQQRQRQQQQQQQQLQQQQQQVRQAAQPTGKQQQPSTGKKSATDLNTNTTGAARSTTKPGNALPEESASADKKISAGARAEAGASSEKKENPTGSAAVPASEAPSNRDRSDSAVAAKTSAEPNSGEVGSISSSTDQKPPAKESATAVGIAGEAPPNPNKDVRTDPERKRSDELGLKFFIPPTPSAISSEQAGLIRRGIFHQAVQGIHDAAKLSAAIGYLHQAGAAVPIQKTLVSGPLKERLNVPGFKASGSNGAPQIPRDVVTSVLLLWLWENHEMNFQRAFEKSGRVDVDPDCKWVIQAAVDIAVRELGHSIAESTARGDGKGQNLKPSPAGSEENREKASRKAEIHTASIVSKGLTTKLHVDAYADQAIPQFEPLVAYLDESRLGALRAKSQERVLLANLLSRKATMSESFSHAYVSAMVRAGEALGHGKLFETAQNEEVHASTMIPYDIFTDDSGAWEDPCQGNDAFPSGLTGEDLMRRAHARAMIQKSLRKLQDRHNIRGGTPNIGPYPENADKEPPSKGVQGKTTGSGSSGPGRPSLKRRYSSISEPPVPPGTGSAKATTRAVYDPKHFSEPLDWPVHHIENKPYGRHRRGQRVRALSLSLSARSGEPRNSKKARRSMSIPAPSDNLPAPSDSPQDTKLPKSSLEITWGDVAGIFTSVEIIPQKRSSLKKAAEADSHHHSIVPADGKIIAPFCRKFTGEVESDSEDSGEEDTSDETVLANHQVILDEMKAKISAFLEARKKQQERRKKK